MLSDRIQLGDFELHAPIGSGGMGEVWRGVHRHHGGTVAVKVVRAEHQPRAFTLAFRNEVRQVGWSADDPVLTYERPAFELIAYADPMDQVDRNYRDGPASRRLTRRRPPRDRRRAPDGRGVWRTRR